jgi:hypothetical protein
VAAATAGPATDTTGSGTPTAAIQPNILGRVGFIFAIIGFVFAVIPPVAILAILFLLPALILGIVGVTRKARKKWTSWGAIIIAVVAFILSIIIYSVWPASLTDSSSSSQSSSSTAPTQSDNPTASSSPSATTAPATYATLNDQDFALLVKNPDGKKGEKVTLFGTITQFDAATGTCVFRANIENVQEASSYDYAQNSLFAGGDGKKSCPTLSNFVQGNYVQISATVLGAYSYDTQNGGNTTVPSFLVDNVVTISTPAQ